MQPDPSDAERHQQLWNNFTRFLTISGVTVAATLILMALFLI